MLRFSAITLMTLLASSSDAFAPYQHSSVGPRIAFETSAGTPNGFVAQQRAEEATTSLQMAKKKSDGEKLFDFYSTAIFIARPDLFVYDRLARMAWDNLSKTFKNLESSNAPDKVLDKALAEMKNDLAKVKKAYAEVSESQRRLQIQKQSVNIAEKSLYNRARNFLSRGYEQTARDLLSRRQPYVDASKKIQDEIDRQEATRTKLGEAIQALENNLNDAMVKKENLIARAQKAKSVKKFNEMIGVGFGKESSKKSKEIFEVIEQQVEKLEAAAEASSLSVAISPVSAADSRLETTFSKLEQEDAVEKQMERIMKDLKNGFEPAYASAREELENLQGEEILDYLLGV